MYGADAYVGLRLMHGIWINGYGINVLMGLVDECI